MRLKLWLLSLFFCLANVCTAQQTAFTANLQELAGGDVSNSRIGLTVHNCSNYILRLPGPGVAIGDTVYLPGDGNGLVALNVPDQASIGCGSTAANADYLISIVDWNPTTNRPILPAKRFNYYDVTGATFNLNTASAKNAPAPASIANAMLLNAAGDQTAVIPAGKKIAFSGGTVDLSGTTCIGCGTGGPGGGITSLNALTGTTQTFGNDTNVTMVSTGTTHQITWAGTLAKARMHAATAFTDQANVFGAGNKQTFSASATTAGLNLAGVTADPSVPASGDHWYRSDTNHFKFRDSASTTHSLFNSDDTLPYSQLSGTPTIPADVSAKKYIVQTADAALPNAQAMGALATGIVKNTTTTGVQSIAVAGDFPTLNQNTTGTAGGLSANIAESQVTNLTTDLAAKALDSAVVHNTGTETIAGAKTFSSAITGALTGNASTATALAANGTNCSPGNYALGVDASGNAEGCTAVPAGAAVPTGTGFYHTTAGAEDVASKKVDISASADVTGVLLAAGFPALTGDVTTSAGDLTTVLANIPTATPAAGSILHTNIAAPSSPAAGKDSVYADSTDLRLHDKNASGVIGTTVVADTGAANNFVTAISAAGTISKAQPSFTNISGSVAAGQMPALTGDVTSSAGSTTTALGNIPTGVTMAGKLIATNIAAPSTPGAGTTAIYVDSSTKKLCSKDDAGSVNCTGSAGGFTAPTGWSAVAGGWTAGTYGLNNTATRTAAGTGTATFYDTQLTLTAVSAASGAGDIHVYNSNATISGPAQANSTWNGGAYLLQTNGVTGAGSVLDHALDLVVRQINNPAASTTTTLGATAWMSQGFTNFAGTAGNLEVMNLNWDAGLNGAGSITNGLKTLDVGLPGTITGGMVPPSVAGVSVGDPTFAPGTSKAAFAVGTPSTTGSFGLWIPSGGNGHFTNPIFVADAAYNYSLEGWLLGTSTSLNGNFTAANTPLQLSCSGACGLGIYNGVIDWLIAENASNNLTLQRPDNGTTALTILNSSAAVQVGALTTWGTASGFAMVEGTAPTNIAGDATLHADSTTHELMVKTNGSATAGQLVRVQPSAINQASKTAAITTATLCAASAGACNVAGQYHIHWDFWGSGTACSSVTAGSVTFLLTWTDENSVAHSAVVMPMLNQTGATSVAVGNSFTFQTALANEGASGDVTISTNGSVIQYATGYTACTTGTGTYNLRASATRLQ